MVIFVLMSQFEMANVLDVVNQYRRLAQVGSESGIVEHPVENGFAVDLFPQERNITGMQNIVVDAPNDFLLVDEISGAVPFSIDGIEQIVLCNVDFEKLLDVGTDSIWIIEWHHLRQNPVIPKVAANTTPLDAAGRIIWIDHKCGNGPPVQEQVLE